MRARLVTRLLRGDLTLEDAAARAGVPPAEVERWIDIFLAAGISALERESSSGVPPAASTPPGVKASAPQPEGERGGERLLRLLPEQLDGTSWTVDSDLRFTSCVGLARFTGRPDGSLIGTRLVDLLPGAEASALPVVHHLRALDGVEGSYETAWLGRALRYRLQPIRAADGTIQGVLGIALDVTERRLSELALREQDERFRFLVEQLPAIFWTTDRTLHVTSTMGRGLALLGESAETLLGASARDYLDVPGTGRTLLDKHHAALRGESGFLLGNWRGRDYESYVEPLRDGDGEIVGVVGLSLDVSERVQLERRRAELLEREHAAREQAEAASRMKDEFLATISHELRTPLNAILGWSQLLREEQVDPDTHDHALATIERNSRVQARLIEDLLDVSNIVNGHIRVEARPVDDFAAITAAALEAVRPSALRQGVRLHYTFDPDAGPILADPERLQQIVWNLVANAIKFTPSGGHVYVQVALERARSKVLLTVRDTGEGIAPAFLPKVFDRFSQGDASFSRRHGGLGIGLAIVRHLVELHGGEVCAESSGEGRGATFTVTLPVLPPLEAREAAPDETPPDKTHRQ